MPEVGCYSLDLYCDGKLSEHCEARAMHGANPATYARETYGECKREAQRHGWKFCRDGCVLCPYCTGKRKPEEQPNEP